MKVLDHDAGIRPASPIRDHASFERTLNGWRPPSLEVDLISCTRCGQPWTFDMVENVEIWDCVACGYEARERSSDYQRIRLARLDLLVS
jgi:Zn ribbon nucleic-acid-binding protein